MQIINKELLRPANIITIGVIVLVVMWFSKSTFLSKVDRRKMARLRVV